MTAQTGGYIVIDCAPLYKGFDTMSLDKDGSVGDYNSDIEIAKQLKYGLDKAKKPIIFNNLIFTESGKTYYINSAIGLAIEEDDGRGGGSNIILPIHTTQKTYTLIFNIFNDLSITINWR